MGRQHGSQNQMQTLLRNPVKPQKENFKKERDDK